MHRTAKRQMPNPIIPGNKQDRTGTAGILRRAVADIRRRYKGAARDVIAAFDRIPAYRVNDVSEADFAVRYGLTPQAMADLSQELAAIMARWLEEGRESAPGFWWSPYDAEATLAGTAQSVANLSAISTAYAAQRSISTVINSEPYRVRIATAQQMSMSHWTGLSQTARADLAGVIGRGIADGLNPRVVRRQIMGTMGISRSRAELYAQTDITGALRQARWTEADYARDEMGIKLGLLWTSALLPTTRPNHASRHGKVYTTEEVRAFYSTGGARFRCHCSTVEALIGDDGKPMLIPSLKQAMAGEKSAWDKTQ